jgi:hypothetical protein
VTTKLARPTRREICIDDIPHTLVLTPTGAHLSFKGHNKTAFIEWKVFSPGYNDEIGIVEPPKPKRRRK